MKQDMSRKGKRVHSVKKSEFAVELRNVQKSFGDEKVLKGITMRFERGKIHGIIGMNGSGKTVMLKCICGFLKPNRGTIIVNGEKIGKDTDFPSSIGLILEAPGFIPQISGFQNLYRLAKLNNLIDANEVRYAMQMVGLDPDLKKAVKTYSLGMRERLGIAQAVMERPDLIVLDEPFNGLDKSGVKEICFLLQNYKKAGKTILLAAHNFHELNILCDTMTELDSGKVVGYRGINK